LESIRANPNPYGQVNRIDALVSTVETVNDALAAEKRSKALLSIDKKLGEALAALSAAHADSDLSNRVLKPLQDLKAQLAGLVSIPRILFCQGRAGDLLDEAMDKIAAAAKVKAQATPAAQPSSNPNVASTASTASTPSSTPVAPVAKPIRVVKPAELSSKSYLETEGEVEVYVSALKAELLAVIASGHRARIQ
jgi:hypothetical protein